MFATKVNSVRETIDVMKPCMVTYTSNSVYIKSEMGKIYVTSSGKVLNPKELVYVREFRSYFKKNKDIKYNRKYACFNPKYFCFYKDTGIFDDIVEVDLNAAYPSAGRILNIIPEDLYQKGLKQSKEAVLVSIGSLYRKKKVIQVFADGRRKMVKDERPEKHLESIWRSIVGYTDYVMQQVAKSCNGGVYFYWCDALFVKRTEVSKVVSILSEYGFTCKTKSVDKLHFTDDKAVVYYHGIKKPKDFSRPVRNYISKNLETVRKRYEQKEK